MEAEKPGFGDVAGQGVVRVVYSRKIHSKRAIPIGTAFLLSLSCRSGALRLSTYSSTDGVISKG